MKTIQFTDKEVIALLGLANINNYTIDLSIREKLKIASLAPNGSTTSIDEGLINVTPAKAYERVSDRVKTARIENDKRHAARMISELEKKCEDLQERNNYQAKRLIEVEENNGKLFELARAAKRMVSELEKKCEELLKENEALNLQITNN